MPALPNPIYSLDKIYLFPTYMTREAYQKATGEEAPPWDPHRAPKYWFDPKAKDSPRRNVVYDSVIALSALGLPLMGADGKPMTEFLVLTREEAGTVNIPPLTANVPGADVPATPTPLRQLEPNEELFFNFGGGVAVKNTQLYTQIENIFTVQDRTVLQAIARKLGV